MYQEILNIGPERIEFKLRIREGLRLEIQKAAKINDVSMNQEVINRLEVSFGLDRSAQTRAQVQSLLDAGY